MQLLASDSAFGGIVRRLSEPGGYFDTDNLISNERSYLHAVGALRRLGIHGGAYVGVGPSQNFSYIAAVRPHVAFIVDLRRDNLLEHLLFKAAFQASETRIEYLCILLGRPCPARPAAWRGREVGELVAYLDGTGRDPSAAERARTAISSRVDGFGVPLSAEDRATIGRFHEAFLAAGLDLRFTSHGRGPRFYYPTLRDLLLERDLEGVRSGFLAREEDFRFVKAMSDANLIVPVVGDFAGRHALAAIGELLREHGEPLSAFYTSNVEFYLVGQGTFPAFLRNLERMPFDERSVLIRSYFGGTFRRAHPLQKPGYASAQLLQRLDALLRAWDEGRIRGYWDLVTVDVLVPTSGGTDDSATDDDGTDDGAADDGGTDDSAAADRPPSSADRNSTRGRFRAPRTASTL